MDGGGGGIFFFFWKGSFLSDGFIETPLRRGRVTEERKFRLARRGGELLLGD